MRPLPRHYDFSEQLQWSDQFLGEGIRRILMDRIPASLDVRKAATHEDKNGTDYWVIRPEPLPRLSVDVKVRRDDYLSTHQKDDLALETWSAVGKRVGWTRDTTKRTDYILWFWQETGRFYLVPFLPLCCAFARYWETWRSEFKVAVQDSGGWQSECVFVPRLVLREKVIGWMEGVLPPPEPVSRTNGHVTLATADGEEVHIAADGSRLATAEQKRLIARLERPSVLKDGSVPSGLTYDEAQIWLQSLGQPR